MGVTSSRPQTVGNCNSSNDTIPVTTETFDVLNPLDGFQIPCKVWKPEIPPSLSSSRKPYRAAVLLIHGGIFTLGDRDTHSELVKEFSRQLNILIVTASFRDGKTTTYKTGLAMEDLKCIARFMTNKKSTNRYKTHELPFGLIGCSSGGYFAMALANQWNDNGNEDDYDDDDNKTVLRFCIPICPVANPHARAMYLKHCLEETTPLGSGKDLYPVRHTPERAREILNHQLQYFETYKQMSLAAQEVDRNLHDVPTLVILGAEDKNVPPQVTEHVASLWAWRVIIVGKGAGHEIQNDPPTDPKLSYIPDMDTFLTGVLEEQKSVVSERRPWCA